MNLRYYNYTTHRSKRLMVTPVRGASFTTWYMQFGMGVVIWGEYLDWCDAHLAFDYKWLMTEACPPDVRYNIDPQYISHTRGPCGTIPLLLSMLRDMGSNNPVSPAASILQKLIAGTLTFRNIGACQAQPQWHDSTLIRRPNTSQVRRSRDESRKMCSASLHRRQELCPATLMHHDVNSPGADTRYNVSCSTMMEHNSQRFVSGVLQTCSKHKKNVE